QMGQENRKIVEENYSSDVNTKKLVDFFTVQINKGA
ncbi:unnamed protein product, partial [marine sediment metagenome]